MRSVHHLTAGTQEPSELKRIRDSFVARHTCSSERIFVKRSLTDALAATARCTTPAGRFVIPHRHKAFGVSRQPTCTARVGTRPPESRPDRRFPLSLAQPYLIRRDYPPARHVRYKYRGRTAFRRCPDVTFARFDDPPWHRQRRTEPGRTHAGTVMRNCPPLDNLLRGDPSFCPDPPIAIVCPVLIWIRNQITWCQ